MCQEGSLYVPVHNLHSSYVTALMQHGRMYVLSVYLACTQRVPIVLRLSMYMSINHYILAVNKNPAGGVTCSIPWLIHICWTNSRA